MIKNSGRKCGERYLTAFLLGFGCFILSMLPILIAEKGYFIYYGDYIAQQIPFYNLANDAVRSGQLGWNWYTDLGSDFLTSYSFYLIGSPFFWLSTLLPRSLVSYSLPFLLALKHGVASLTAYAYIRRFVRSKESALIGGLLYSFSGFQLFNIFFNHFHDVTAFFPLMLIAMEECINNRRRGVFALTVGLMACINYYFFAGQAVFLVFYYLFRMKCPDFHTSWKKFAGLAFEAIIGTMIATFILLPSAISIMGNYRVNSFLYNLSTIIYADETLIPRIIQSFFMIPDVPAYPNLILSDYNKWSSIGGYLPLFSMVGVAAFMKTRKKHWASKLIIFCIICAFIPILNSMFQAMNSFYYARWFYMPILIMAMMTAHTIDDEESDTKFGIGFCTAVLAAYAVIGIMPTQGENEEPLFLMLPYDLNYFWIIIAIAAVFMICTYIVFSRRQKGRPFMIPAIVMTAVASVICVLATVLYGAASVSSANNYVRDTIEYKDKIYEASTSDNFFRSDVSEGCDNYNMMWQIPGLRTFQSTVNGNIIDFYNKVGVDRKEGSRPGYQQYTLRGLLSVKYYYREIGDYLTYEEIKAKEQSLAEHSNAAAAIATKLGLGDDPNSDITKKFPGFEYIGRNGNFEIYENTLFIPMGFAYDTYVPQYDADEKSEKTLEKLLIKSLVLNNEQIEKYSDILTKYDPPAASLSKDSYAAFCREKQKKCSSSFTYDSYGFTSEITLDKPQLVFFSVPYSEGWTAEVNGKPADVEFVSYGFMAVRAEAGENKIVFHYRTPGLTEGFFISLAGVLLLVIYVIICRRKRGDDDGHTHFYDYSSCRKISAAEAYRKSFETKGNAD